MGIFDVVCLFVTMVANAIAGFLQLDSASLNDNPFAPTIEQLAKQQAVTENKVQLLENKKVPISDQIGQIVDDKWEDKRRAVLLEMKAIQKAAEAQRARDDAQQRAKYNHLAVEARIAELERQAEEQKHKQGPDFSSFGKRLSKIEKAQEETAPLKQQYGDLSSKVESITADQDDMKKDINANTEALEDVQGRVLMLENSRPVSQVNVTNLEAGATSMAGAGQTQADACGCDREEMNALTTKTADHKMRIEKMEDVFKHLKPVDMWDAFTTTADKIVEHDRYFREIQIKVPAIEATQQRQAELINEDLAKHKQSAEQQLAQPKESSGKEHSDCKKSMKEQMERHEASVREQVEKYKAEKDQELKDYKAAKDEELEKHKAAFEAYVAKTDAEQKAQDDRHNDLLEFVNQLAAQLNGQNTSQQFPVPGQQPPQFVPPQPTPPPQGNGPWTSTPTPPNQGPQPVPSLDVEMGGFHDGDAEMMDAPSDPPQHAQPSQPAQQPPRQPTHRPTPSLDTPMAFGGPLPNNNGNVGALQQPQQPMSVSPAFPGNGPTKPFPSTPSASALQRSPQLNPGTGPSNPAPSAPAPATPMPSTPAAPTYERGELFKRSVFASGAHGPIVPAGQKPLQGPMPTPAQAPAPAAAKTSTPKQFDFSAPLPTVNKPQIDWSGQMGKMDFDPPAELSDDDDKPLAPKAKMPPATAAPVTPSTGQPAANMATSGHNGASSAVKVNGPSSTNAPAPPMANNAGPSSSTVRPPSTPAKPTLKPAKKKADPLVKRKPTATPSKPAPVTSKAQTTVTPAASLAAKKQAAFALYGTPPSQKTGSPAPVAPMAPLQPAEDESELWVGTLTGAVNISPFALKPKASASAPRASPIANSSPTHTTVESNSAANVFLKDIVVVPEATTGSAEAGAAEAAKPEGNDDAQMSDVQSEPEATEAAKAEVNPRKHVHPEDAPVIQQEDAMDTDRKLVKAKGLASEMTAAQRKAHTDDHNNKAAWAERERAVRHDELKAAKAAAQSQEDEVDYADPNDINDEDVHTTVMVPHKPSARPTRFSVKCFDMWKEYLLKRQYLAALPWLLHRSPQDILRLIKQVRELDQEDDLEEVPTTKGPFTKSGMKDEMENFRDTIFFEAISATSIDPVGQDDWNRISAKINTFIDGWLKRYPPDTV